jgi:hypothetical protein
MPLGLPAGINTKTIEVVVVPQREECARGRVEEFGSGRVKELKNKS